MLPVSPVRQVCITQSALADLMSTVGARPAESGGILLGPIGQQVITRFHFDEGGSCTGVTYTPDHFKLRDLMRTWWLPAGIDMKGFGHSHPAELPRPSRGDLVYIGRLLRANPDMTVFVAPIVIPDEFRVVPFVVESGDVSRAQPATFDVL